jgi:N-formylglutamate amidohydrolase
LPQPLDPSGWVAASDGTMPLVLVAPHGGDQSPAVLPDRTCAQCVIVNDANTAALMYAISDAFHARIGRRPFVVANRLHRRKFDGNRDRAEATGNYTPLDSMWRYWQANIDTAKARATRVHPRALLLDLHGHAHSISRIEIGYLLTANNLRETDLQLSQRLGNSSIARLDSVGRAGVRGAPMLRGTLALGSRLAALGYPAVPSDVDPAPLVGQEYFTGGYNTERHGSRSGGPVDAIQLEHHFTGVRDTPESRAAYAEAIVTALLAYLADHYGWSPAA